MQIFFTDAVRVSLLTFFARIIFFALRLPKLLEKKNSRSQFQQFLRDFIAFALTLLDTKEKLKF
jgi:hypothetical protein